jgi:hypothetical protein
MALLLKTAPPIFSEDRQFWAQEPRWEKAEVAWGDVVYVWTSEMNGGIGLALKGRLTAVEGELDARRLNIRVAVTDAAPVRRLTIHHLKPHRDSGTAEPISSLARKLYRHSLNKIADLTPAERTFLEAFFT